MPPRDATRVRNLAAFQLRALTHALSFPSLRRVVYSTCSLYVEEDEAVVAGALAACARAGVGVRVVRCLPEWPMRGAEGAGGLSAEQAQCCVRWDPRARSASGEGGGGGGGGGGAAELGEVGFFVALLERTGAAAPAPAPV